MDSLGVVYQVLEKGGPLAIGALCVIAWLMERKERQEMQKTMFELATNQIINQVNSNNEVKSSLSSLRDLLNQISSRL